MLSTGVAPLAARVATAVAGVYNTAVEVLSWAAGHERAGMRSKQEPPARPGFLVCRYASFLADPSRIPVFWDVLL